MKTIMKQKLLIALFSIGMILNANAQDVKLTKVAHRFYFNAGYLMSTNADNAKESSSLFAGNGTTLGFSYGLEFSKQFGIMTHANYSFGKVNNDGINSYKNRFDSQIPLTFSATKANWSQAQLMTGILVKPILKVPFFVELTGGLGFRPNANTITIQQNDNGVIGSTLYQATEKSTSMAWNSRVFYTISKAESKKHAYVFAGFGSNGVTIGATVSIAESCCFTQCPCALICPCDPKPSK